MDEFQPRGCLYGQKSGYLASFDFDGILEMRELAQWMKDNGWLTTGRVSQDKSVEFQPSGFTPTCPDHKSDMRQSKHSPDSYYCDVKSGGQKCKQRWNKKGYFLAK